MTVKLYNCNSPKDHVNKHLSLVAEIKNAEFLEPFNLDHPTIKLKHRAFNFNYIEVVEHDRFYFIGTPTLEAGGIMRIPCKCDLLKTFSYNVYASNYIGNRSSVNYNKEIADSTRFVNKTYTTTAQRLVNTPFNSHSYCLIVGGK